MAAAEKSAELCWGQRYIWLRHHQLPPTARHEAHIVSTFPLPDGTPLVGVRTMLNYLVRRHEALRTTYHCDGADGPRQRVHPPRGLPLSTVSTERDGTESPAEVIERLTSTPFELATEWPIRACAVLTGGRPTKLVLVLNHIAFDAWTVDRFEQELQALGAGIGSGRPAALPPVRHQPVDLALHEASPTLRAESEAALGYWREEIRQLPSDPLAGRRRGGNPAAHSATLTSPELLQASRQLAASHQVWPSVVHLTAHAMLMAAYTGSARTTALAFTGNRNARSHAEVLTCMFSPLLMWWDCPAEFSFGQLLTATAERFERGQQNSYVPYDELLELVAGEGDRRGEPIRLGSEFNFLSQANQASRARRSRLVWNAAPESWACYGADSYLRAYELRDAAVISLNASGAVLDASAVEAFLRGYERLLLLPPDELNRLRVGEVAELAGFPAVTPAGTAGLAVGQPRVGSAAGPAVRQPATGSAAELALAAAVAEVNGLGSVELTGNYTVAGGRVLRIPAVLEELRVRGWTGLSVYDLAGALPLSGLAKQLGQPAERAA
jgi:hypothetical protein